MTDAADREQWAQWKEETFGSGYMIWHEGLDVGRVTGLAGEVRDEVERMLLLGLRLGDPHAAEALAAMESRHLLPRLRQAMREAGSGVERMKMALAVHALAPADELLEPVIELLRTGEHWSLRMDAAIALRRFSGTRAAEAALQAVAEDPAYHVRYHAADSAHALLGLKGRTPTDDPELFALLLDRKKGEWEKRAKARWASLAQRLRERADAGGAAGVHGGPIRGG